MTGEAEFTGRKGRFLAWFLTSPLRRLLEWRMGRPEARILARLALEGSERVLDAGCGSGFHSLLVAEHLPEGHVVAVDLSEEMLARLRRLAARRGLEARIEAHLADALALPLPANSVDRAFSAAVWHHLDDPAAACAELARVVRPGGRVVVSDLYIEAGHAAVRGLHGHDRAFDEGDMRAVLEGAGLVDVEVERVGQWVIGSGDKRSEQ